MIYTTAEVCEGIIQLWCYWMHFRLFQLHIWVKSLN